MTEVWAQRKQISDIKKSLNVEDYADPPCRFELEYVIGRRAFDRRMNIKIDQRGRISYQASSLQVFLTENKDASEEEMREQTVSNIK
jgi:hypothetical protein